MDKVTLRKTLLQTRQAIPTETWQVKSNQIVNHLRSAAIFTQAKTILAYFSIRQEPDLSSLFTVPKIWGFPRCVGKSLSLHVWSPQSPLQTGAYAIPEPPSDAPMLEPEQVELLLVPAIACDTRGYRLGYGGGFYDRLLAAPVWAQKPTIGIVFESARLRHLPNDPWDQPLTAICTEAGLFFAER